MKTHKNLYPQIAHFGNLYQAWRKARRGKRYKPSVAEFEQNLGMELTEDEIAIVEGLKREAKLLLDKAINSLLLSVDHFNKASDVGRVERHV